MRNAAGFEAAFRTLSKICQYGLHYHGSLLVIHVGNMRSLYLALVSDLHQRLMCFWNKPLLSYDQLMASDSLFPQTGSFYGIHRQLMTDVTQINSLTRFGVFDSRPSDPGAKRSRAQAITEASIKPTPARAAGPLQVGSLAWAVKEDSDYLTVFDFKYAKSPIFDKLQLKDTDICLASYLSRKGAAVCPHADQPGHEHLSSPLHVYSAAVEALRPSFDKPPYLMPHEGGASSHSGGKGKGSGKTKGKWRSWRASK